MAHHLDRRLGVGGLALGLEPRHDLGRIAFAQQRPRVLARDALDQGGDVAIEPDRDAALEDQRARRRLDEGAAAGRQK